MKTYNAATLSSNTTHQLALMIGDTSTEAKTYLFEDEELAWFISEANSDLRLAAARACRAAASSAAKTAVAATILGESWDKKSISDRYLRLAQEFERSVEKEPYSERAALSDGDLEFSDNLTNRTAFDFENADAEA